MSSDSDESSNRSSAEEERLNTIWKSIKQTKNLSQAYRSDSRHPIHTRTLDPQPTQSPFYNHNQHFPSDKHTKVNEFKSNIVHLAQKIQELTQENQALKGKIQKMQQVNEDEINSIRKDFEHKLKSHMKKTKIVEKQNWVNNEGDKTDLMYKQIQRLGLKIKSLELEKRKKQAECQKLAELNEAYLLRLSEEQGGALVSQVGKGEQLLELEQANTTIERLVYLLKRTQQYKQYSPLMQEMKNLHYLKNIVKRMKNNQLNFKPIERKTCSCSQIKLNQKLLWSPTQCYRIMLNMKVKYDYLNQDCIEEVLFQINRIYAAKEQKSLNKMKEYYDFQLQKVKKQMEQTYDEILANKKINRLKKQLSVVKSANKPRKTSKMSELREKGQVQDELKLKLKEVKLLKERLKIFEAQNGNQDRELYYQGAIWAMDKLLAEIQGNQSCLKEFQIAFRDKIQDNLQPEDWLKSYKEFFETLTELNNGLVQRILGLKENALKKMVVKVIN